MSLYVLQNIWRVDIDMNICCIEYHTKVTPGMVKDYAYWYGWNEMTKDLGEIKELARTMRAQH